jgi:hypothetical protein
MLPFHVCDSNRGIASELNKNKICHAGAIAKHPAYAIQDMHDRSAHVRCFAIAQDDKLFLPNTRDQPIFRTLDG